MPSPLSMKVTPLGRAPDSDSAAVGTPVEVTVKVPAMPSVKVVLSPEVMAGAASTVRVKDWLASGLQAVGGGDGDRVGALGAGRRRAGQRGRAVTVVGEGHPAGQGPISDRPASG